MRRRGRLLLPLVVLGCSNLTEADGGVVAVEIRVPSPAVIEVGESLQLSARGLNRNGDSVATTLTWVTPDTTLTVDPATGVVTGRAPGTGRIQARSGSLASAAVSFDVIAPADTLILASDSVETFAADQPTSPALLVRLESFHPAGALAGRPVIYEITSPSADQPLSVVLPNGTLSYTGVTGSDGVVSTAALSRVAGATLPDSVVVQVRAARTRGAAVPGSGQRFIVHLQ